MQTVLKISWGNVPKEWFVNFCPTCYYSITFDKTLPLEPQTMEEWNQLAEEVTAHDCVDLEVVRCTRELKLYIATDECIWAHCTGCLFGADLGPTPVVSDILEAKKRHDD